jgi:hypothetical protein
MPGARNSVLRQRLGKKVVLESGRAKEKIQLGKLLYLSLSPQQWILKRNTFRRRNTNNCNKLLHDMPLPANFKQHINHHPIPKAASQTNNNQHHFKEPTRIVK